VCMGMSVCVCVCYGMLFPLKISLSLRGCLNGEEDNKNDSGSLVCVCLCLDFLRAQVKKIVHDDVPVLNDRFIN